MQTDNISGFVKFPRYLRKEGVFRDVTDFGFFIHLLMMAAHKPVTVNYRRKPWRLEIGQLVTTHSDLRKLGIGPNTIRTALRNFEADGKISIRANKAGTIITICNYAEIYGALSKVNTETNKQATDGQHTAITQNKNLRNKEDKNFQELASVSQGNVRPFSRAISFTAAAQNLLKNVEGEQ